MKILSDYTSARVNLGVAGNSLPTKPLLAFRLAHAQARDAVHFSFDAVSLGQEMAQRGWHSQIVHSNATSRDEYLRRPDKGRVLDDASDVELAKLGGRRAFAFVVADGLSALAVHRHAIPFLERIFQGLDFHPDQEDPIVIAQQGRVAIGDQIGSLLGADLAIVLIGERPGLSSPDSLGVYLTWQPRAGRTDAERNCISNIHEQGLSYEVAAHRLVFLAGEARRQKLTGVALKETAGLLPEIRKQKFVS